MPTATAETIPETAGRFEQAFRLLGGENVLRRTVASALDAHDLLADGLPNRALIFLMDGLVLPGAGRRLERALGISLRTLQRKKENPDATLDLEQSGRTWTFAQLLAAATDVFGTQEAAERWFDQPAIGLDRQRPIDLLSTPAGRDLVATYLEQLEFGVYV